jgi:hypothetical protein
MKLVGNRVVVTGTDQVSKSVKGLGKATSETATKQRYAERSTSRLTTSYKKLGSAAKYGLGFLGVGGVLAIQSSIHASEELGKTTAGLTRNFGLQNNVASRWAAVAQSREIDSKALSMSFGALSSRIVEAAHKGGTALTPFHRLGISQEELVSHANDAQWALMRVAKALGEEEGGTKRTTTAKALLGKGFTTLLPLFSEGTKGLKEQLRWADKYGVTLSGSTTDGIMEMVSAQRENKVATLGLQLALTKALMPAIKAGDDQLQEFIATLNSSKLTEEQKISRMSHQFLSLEGDIIKVIDKSLPTIAEHAGHLGIALARALWHGFIHSDTLGKLFIGAWLFRSLGGFSLVGMLGARVGGKLATSLGSMFLKTVAPYFAAEVAAEGLGGAVAARMGAMGVTFGSFGAAMGTAFGVAMIAAAAGYVVLHQQDILDALGVDTNHGMLTGTSREEEARQLTEAGWKVLPFGMNGHVIHAVSPGGSKTSWVEHGGKWVVADQHGHAGTFKPPKGAGTEIVHVNRGHAPRRQGRRAELMAMPRGGGGAGQVRTLVIHNHLHADGREIAELVTEHALDAAALA